MSKAVAKTIAKKKVVAKSTSAPVRKIKAVSKRLTKSEQVLQIAVNTGLTKKDVQSVLDKLAVMIEAHLKPRSCGEFMLPGLLKIVKVSKPATKARKGINPFTGEETVFKAKPASKQVKIRPLVKLKAMVD